MLRAVRPLRVLTTIESLGRGGAEQALTVLAPELLRRGVQLEVAALYGPYTLSPSLEDSGVRVHRLELSHRWNLAELALKLRLLAGVRPFDVVHGHLFFGYLAAAALARTGGARAAVATLHGLAYDAYPATTAMKRARRRFDAQVLRHGFGLVTAVSAAVARHYVSNLGLPMPHVLGNAVRVSAEVSELPRTTARAWLGERFGIPSAALAVVVPARLVREKGHTHLLHALSLLPEDLPLRAVLLGGGPLREELEAEARRRNVLGQVLFAGEVSADDVQRAMRGADVVALPSVSEGLPMVICEAAQLGCALLATRAGGIPEAVGDEGGALLVEPGPASATALADGLQRLAGDRALRDSLGARAKAAAHRFTPSVIADAWLELYARVSGMASATGKAAGARDSGRAA